MSSDITASVGVNGVNRLQDVKTVQTCLNAFTGWTESRAPLKVDGIIGDNTIDAIEAFQRQAVGMEHPDGRVDPDGRTIELLGQQVNPQPHNETAHAEATEQPGEQATDLAAYTVSYKNSVKPDRRLVSDYALTLIKMALRQAEMKTAVITSTLRTPQEQAEIMLRNAKLDLAKQYRLYGRNGDAVLKVYELNQDKPDSEIIANMVDEINKLEQSNRRVSNHCLSQQAYQEKNIFDIGVNSTREANEAFHQQEFTDALQNLANEGYIDRLIDETAKSNQCWHIEVTPGRKPLDELNEGIPA